MSLTTRQQSDRYPHGYRLLELPRQLRLGSMFQRMLYKFKIQNFQIFQSDQKLVLTLGDEDERSKNQQRIDDNFEVLHKSHPAPGSHCD